MQNFSMKNLRKFEFKLKPKLIKFTELRKNRDVRKYLSTIQEKIPASKVEHLVWMRLYCFSLLLTQSNELSGSWV